jgi:hypothetical protein
MNSKAGKLAVVIGGGCGGLLVLMLLFRVMANSAREEHSPFPPIDETGIMEYRAEQARALLGRELSSGESAKYLFYDLTGITSGYEAFVGRDILVGNQISHARQATGAVFLMVELVALFVMFAVVIVILRKQPIVEAQAAEPRPPAPPPLPPNRGSPPRGKIPPRKPSSRRIPPRPGAPLG